MSFVRHGRGSEDCVAKPRPITALDLCRNNKQGEMTLYWLKGAQLHATMKVKEDERGRENNMEAAFYIFRFHP